MASQFTECGHSCNVTPMETERVDSTSSLLPDGSAGLLSVFPGAAQVSDVPEPCTSPPRLAGGAPSCRVNLQRHRLALLAALSCCTLLLLSQLAHPQALQQLKHLQQLPQQPDDSDAPAVQSTAGTSTSERTSTSTVPTSTTGADVPTAEPSATSTAAPAPPPPPTPRLPLDCLSVPVISAQPGGRLGNNLAEYATIYALGLRYDLTAVATPDLLDLMRDVFPHLTLPVVRNECLYQEREILVEKFEKKDDAEKRARSWEVIYYTHRISLFWRYRDRLRREFAFRSELADGAQGQLREVALNRTGLTFVGVHVRRTDYRHHLRVMFNGKLLNESFYKGAMDLCRKRYRQPVFIVTSDDLEWCRQHLAAPDVYVIGDPRAISPGVEMDLALLAACNHTIFDYGTFGFFGAFLAGGDLVLADNYVEKEHEIVSELRTGGINATYLDPAGRLLPHCVLCNAPTLPPEQTKSPTLPPEQTKSPKLPLGQTKSPTLPPEQTKSPTLPPEQTKSPTLPLEQTKSPTMPLEQTKSPTLPLEQTKLPTLPLEQTKSPTLPLGQTKLPTLPMEQTKSPTLLLEQTKSSILPLEQTKSPTLPPEQTKSPTVPPLHK